MATPWDPTWLMYASSMASYGAEGRVRCASRRERELEEARLEGRLAAAGDHLGFAGDASALVEEETVDVALVLRGEQRQPAGPQVAASAAEQVRSEASWSE